MDITGNAGPTIKKILICEGCQWLSDIKGCEYKRYSCLHPDVISKYKDDSEIVYKIFVGTLNKDLSTPMFCPYILKKMRLEKIKEIDD